MELIHGSGKTEVLVRITARAMAIMRTGASREELRDPSDINSNEEREIEFAESLAAAWTCGESIDAWHLPGVSELYQ